MDPLFWIIGFLFLVVAGLTFVSYVLLRAFFQLDNLLVETRQELARQNTTNRQRSAGLADHNDRLQRLETRVNEYGHTLKNHAWALANHTQSDQEENPDASS